MGKATVGGAKRQVESMDGGGVVAGVVLGELSESIGSGESQSPPATERGAGEVADIGAATPMVRQYLEIKAQHPDAVLFFRLGDFYEMFFEDATRAAELLQITLTSRAKGSDRIPMCGVPYHSAQRYIARLIEHGLKVAICEQVEEAGGPGIVRREVIRIITPGTVLDEELVAAGENRYLAACCPTDKLGLAFGGALLDATTGELVALPEGPLAEIVRELERAAPRELLVPEEAKGSDWLDRVRSGLARSPAVGYLGRGDFDTRRGQEALKRQFQVASLDGFGVQGAGASLGAAGALLKYLKETQRSEAQHVVRISLLRRETSLHLDESSLSNLEVVRTLKDGSRKGSLLGAVDRTVTGMGGRKLARWLSAPLLDLGEIDARLDAVAELRDRSAWREELAASLKQVADVERLCGRLALGVGTARELKGLGRTLGVLPALVAGLERFESTLLRMGVAPLVERRVTELGSELERALVDEPPATLREGGLFRQGYHRELDELISLSTEGKDFLLGIETRERARTGITSLKVRFNKVFGYYIEVTRANLHLVPPDYVRKQTTVNSERYVTPELKEHEEKVLSAEERRIDLELELFEALRAQVVAAAGPLREVAEAIATLDALISFGRLASEPGYVRPTVDDSEVIDIVDGRHPAVERLLDREVFVPNDIRLDAQEAQLLVITGPNMAGKSTVMRQVALTVLLAQAGSFVPARKARIGLCDRIFTRVGAADNLARGQSTFMVEMNETANILHHATRRSLVVLDEIGRGTSTFDGLSIAWAVGEYLHDRIGARTLFATHYHELTDLAREKPRVRNGSFAVKESGGRLVFLRKLVSGGASRSYGIEVAKLAGLPSAVVGRAKEILRNLESSELDESGRTRLARALTSVEGGDSPVPVARPPVDQLVSVPVEAAPPRSDAAAEDSVAEAEILESLRAMNLDGTTPLEALVLLSRWKSTLKGGRSSRQ